MRWLNIKKNKDVNNEELYLMSKNGDCHAKDMLLENCIPLVISLAKKWKSKGMSYEIDDLVGIGFLEMQIAYDGYKLDKGYKFTTYIRRCIEHKYIKLIRSDCRIKNCKYQSISLDASYDDEDGDSLHSFIPSEEYLNTSERVINKISINNLISEFNSIATDTEKKIIHKVYNEGKIYEQVAIEISSSESTTRRNHNKIISKMREMNSVKLA